MHMLHNKLSLLFIAISVSAAYGADYHEPDINNDFGVKVPGQRVSAEVHPPGTVLTGKNTSAGGFTWLGGPQTFTATVVPVTGGVHLGKFSGTYAPRGTGGVPRVFDWDMQSHGVVVQLTSQTYAHAADFPKTPDTRLKIGITEKVSITSNVAMDTWYAVHGTPTSGPAGTSFVWSAPDYPGTFQVTGYYKSYPTSIIFEVVTPNDVKLTKTQDFSPNRNQIGAGMESDVVVWPIDVSFVDFSWKEEGGRAADPLTTSGYFNWYAYHPATPPKNGLSPWNHHPNPDWLLLNDNNKVYVPGSETGGDRAWFFIANTPRNTRHIDAVNELLYSIPNIYQTPDASASAVITHIYQTGRMARVQKSVTSTQDKDDQSTIPRVAIIR